MSLESVISRYYPDGENGHHYNCAEAMLLAMNEYYKLEISEDAKVQMLAFGGGFGVGSTCGLLVGGYAGIAQLYEKQLISQNDTLRTILIRWHNVFMNDFKTTQCETLKNVRDRCAYNAQHSSYLLENYLKLL